jgi:predicted lipoprotein with Yx(FWY)xxD motif
MERGNTMMTTPRERARRAPIAGLVAAAAATGTLSLLPASSAGASNAVTVSAQTIGKMGKVLVIKGKAAYTLVPSSSPCNAACLKIWPAVTVPATVTKVGAGAGVQQSTLGVTTGPGGTHQVTYKGKPLFYFFEDKKGTVKGNITDQWGKWTAVVVAKPKGGSSGSGSSSNTGSGANAGGGGVNF